MKHNHKFFQIIFLSALLLALLAACGPRVKFVAPEINPPADLIPGYVPEGFELVGGYLLDSEGNEFMVSSSGNEAQALSDEDFEFRVTTNEDGSWPLAYRELPNPMLSLKSPAGNDISGVYYQSRDQILLISKSSFPGGSLELWQAAYEASYIYPSDCDCDCPEIAIEVLVPPRFAEIQEMRTVAGTQVAILQNPGGWVTVFMCGDYLIAVESGISLEENLKVVESLLR